MELIATIIALVLVCSTVAGAIFFQGRKQGQASHDKQVLDDVNKAKQARNNLAADPEQRKRVRDRFTR